jgi:hypothetical protein
VIRSGEKVRGDAVQAIGVGVDPGVEKVGGLGEEDALPLPALYPGEVSQPLHHVVRVAEADLGRAGQLVEPPQMAGIHEERAYHPGGPGREERLERAGGRTQVGLAFLLDENIAEGEKAVTGEIEVTEPVALEEGRPLRADVLGDGHRIGTVHLSAELPQPGNGLPDLPGLSDGSALEKQGVVLSAKLELHQQISLLPSNLWAGRLFPGHSLRKQLPKSLGRRSPDFLLVLHRFTCSMFFSVR